MDKASIVTIINISLDDNNLNLKRSAAGGLIFRATLSFGQVLMHSVQMIQYRLSSIVPGYSKTGQASPFSLPLLQSLVRHLWQVFLSALRNYSGAKSPNNPQMAPTGQP